jgi:hypothetical protein
MLTPRLALPLALVVALVVTGVAVACSDPASPDIPAPEITGTATQSAQAPTTESVDPTPDTPPTVVATEVPTPPPTPTPTPAPAPDAGLEEGLTIELDAASNFFVIEGSDIRMQFLEVFEAVRCPSQGRCSEYGAATVLIGVSGPGVFPIIVELALGTRAYGVSGYDLVLESIDRSDSGDTVVISATVAGVGLSGGVLATFELDEEVFRVWVTDPVTADMIVALASGEISDGFPLGPLRPGAGETNHNLPHRWHLDPEATRLVPGGAGSAECDALPSALDTDRERWLDTVGTYCPSSARLINVLDLRVLTP